MIWSGSLSKTGRFLSDMAAIMTGIKTRIPASVESVPRQREIKELLAKEIIKRLLQFTSNNIKE
jgi:hypothetical protein